MIKIIGQKRSRNALNILNIELLSYLDFYTRTF